MSMSSPPVRSGQKPRGRSTPPIAGGLDRYFGISSRGSTIGAEVRGGFATFFAMSYIVVLNPLILGTVRDVEGELIGGFASPAMAISAVAAVTALAAGLLTLFMGVLGRYPFAIAAGLGLNSYLAATVVQQVSWEEAMGLVVLEGVVIMLLVITKVRTAVLRAIPGDLKTAMSVGIGLFIVLVGLVNAGFVRRIPDAAGTPVPVQLGIAGELKGWPIVVFVFGLLLTLILVMRRVTGGIVIGILATTVLAVLVEAVFAPGPAVVNGQPVPTGWRLNVPGLPTEWVSLPDFSLIGEVDLFGAFTRIGVLAAVMIVFALLLTDFFDTMGTVIGLSNEAGFLSDDGSLPGVGRVLFVDSAAAAAGGFFSASSNTTYIESAAGIGEGARTGLASVITGASFLVAIFLAPLVATVPFEAASAALVVVGLAMVSQIRRVDFTDSAIAMPALLTAVLMPFTYSITAGLGAGLVCFVVLRVFQGRPREVNPLLWGVAGLFVLYFARAGLQALAP